MFEKSLIYTIQLPLNSMFNVSKTFFLQKNIAQKKKKRIQKIKKLHDRVGGGCLK